MDPVLGKSSTTETHAQSFLCSLVTQKWRLGLRDQPSSQLFLRACTVSSPVTPDARLGSFPSSYVYRGQCVHMSAGFGSPGAVVTGSRELPEMAVGK